MFPKPFRPVAEYFTITFKSKTPVFIPRWLANDIMNHYHFVTLEDTGEIYVYNPDSGIYELRGEPLIRILVSINLGDLHRKRHAEEVVYEIQIATFKQRGEFKVPLGLFVQYERMSNPIKAFVMDHIVIAPENEIPKDDLYEHYIGYCTENSLPARAKNIFSFPRRKPSNKG